MQYLALPFFISLLITLLILRFQHLHGKYTADHDLTGVQKFHSRAVPRIGGLGIMVAMVVMIGWLFISGNSDATAFALLILASSPAFLGGIIEDCTKKVRSLIRLLLTMIAAALAFYLLDAGVFRLDIPFIDLVMAFWPVSLLFTVVAVGGVANAINIIDGYNGLASMVSVLMFAALGYVGFLVGDTFIWRTALIMMGAILGFFVWNYPRGLIFLGDGGAYLIGFMLAELSVLLVTRNPSVSPWFPLLVIIYPIFETVFSIYRRVIVRGGAADIPDAAHLHQLVYKRMVRWAVGSKVAREKTTRNAMTSPYLWFLCSVSVVPAMLFWQHAWMLQLCVGAFIVLYIVLYRRLVHFNAPRWLLIKKARQDTSSDDEKA
ncbi:glycosyltransferase [Oxalobacter vibrioformis]|uniref:Glycosyltransferase n=2 Tax=Oxalobacter vibrioformis TaxID=933080 RepID=A0A9E9LUH7_9BURK|nr:glycosyltransferase [Oxalobacter vibrioformis]WAW09094.1 glycosyltransferase [Oxalobacter vibrioformis]